MAASLAHANEPSGSGTYYLTKLHGLGSSPSPAGWERSVPASRVAGELAASLKHGKIPLQDNTSLCGPAAFFFCLLRDRPDLFAKAVFDLWTTGEALIGKLSLKPNAGVLTNWRNETTRFVDWMLLGSLRASGGRLPIQGSYTTSKEQWDAMTTPDRMMQWFGKAGMAILRSKVNDPAHKLLVAAAAFKPELAPLVPGTHYARDLLDLQQARSIGWVVLLIDSSLFDEAPSILGKVLPKYPNHWIVLNPTAPIWLGERRGSNARPPVRIPIGRLTKDQDTIGETPLGQAILSLQAVTWGKDSHALPASTTVDRFFSSCFFSINAAHLR